MKLDRRLLLRGAVAALCLTPPAILMGATLPALYRCARSATSGGTIYAANLVGAVLGCLWAGFYLLPRYDMATATYAAAALNFTLAGVSFLASKEQAEIPTEESETAKPDPLILTAIALSGFCALGAESAWTRTLGLLFGASVYTLSLILAAFLAGLGLGSYAGTRIGRPREALGAAEGGLVPAVGTDARGGKIFNDIVGIMARLAVGDWFRRLHFAVEPDVDCGEDGQQRNRKPCRQARGHLR